MKTSHNQWAAVALPEAECFNVRVIEAEITFLMTKCIGIYGTFKSQSAKYWISDML